MAVCLLPVLAKHSFSREYQGRSLAWLNTFIFGLIILGRVWAPLSLDLWVKFYHCYSSPRMALEYFPHTCESTFDTLPSSATNQGDNTVSVLLFFSKDGFGIYYNEGWYTFKETKPNNFKLLILHMNFICLRFCLQCCKLESVGHCLWGKQYHDPIHTIRNNMLYCITFTLEAKYKNFTSNLG